MHVMITLHTCTLFQINYNLSDYQWYHNSYRVNMTVYVESLVTVFPSSSDTDYFSEQGWTKYIVPPRPANTAGPARRRAIATEPVNARKIIRGAWSIAPVKKRRYLNSLLNHFIHFQLQNIAPSICLQIPSNVKVTLGKSLLALKYLI
jgi:hypothetical protein